MPKLNRRRNNDEIIVEFPTEIPKKKYKKRKKTTDISEKALKKDLKKLERQLRKDLDGLTRKQRDFVNEYLKDYNGTAAAIRAGYSERSAHVIAHDLLKHPKIFPAINHYEKGLSTRFTSTKERVLKEMNLLAYSDMGDYLDENGDLRVTNLKDLPPMATRAIKKIRFHKVTRKLAKDGKEGKAGDEIEYVKAEFELYDKVQTLIKMGQEVGIFKDKRELTGEGGTPLIPQAPTTIIFDFGKDDDTGKN